MEERLVQICMMKEEYKLDKANSLYESKLSQSLLETIITDTRDDLKSKDI